MAKAMTEAQQATLSELQDQYMHLVLELEAHVDPETGEVDPAYDTEVNQRLLALGEEALLDKLNRYLWVRKHAQIQEDQAEAERKQLDQLVAYQRARRNEAKGKADWAKRRVHQVMMALGWKTVKLAHFSCTRVQPSARSPQLRDPNQDTWQLPRRFLKAPEVDLVALKAALIANDPEAQQFADLVPDAEYLAIRG